MRIPLALLLLCGLALAHGESGRTSAPSGTANGGFGVPHGGVGPPTSPRGSTVTTVVPQDGRAHRWDIWWSYNREWILAERTRGAPVTGLRSNDVLSRKKLREKELTDLMLGALEDKDHDVRSAAAVALGKFGAASADRALTRHLNLPAEKWFDVREAAAYAVGLLGLEENRGLMIAIAGDDDRTNKMRALALTGLLMDGTEESADLLVWHLRYFRSGVRSAGSVAPVTAEQERRRFAAHLLGFVGREGYDDVLGQAAAGSRKWHEGEQGLAITALGRRGAREYKEQLFRMLYQRDLDREAVRSVPLALGMLLRREDRDDINRLARFIRDSRRDNVAQDFTVMALANLGGDQVVDIYDDLLRDRVFNTDNDRGFVYLALGLVGGRSEKAREILLAAYQRARTVPERSVLAVACGLAKVQGAVPITLDLIEKGSLNAGGAGWGFPGWGALALGLHADPRAVPAVRRAFRRYSDDHVRENAAIALSMLEGKAAVPELVAILRDSGTMHTKAAVVTALGILPEPSRDAVDALVAAYRDDSMPNPVRAMAIIALGALGDPRPVPLSALLVRNYNYFIRCAALDEIASLL